MDIEKLNKSQIVLLTLLVSFMTSIATGIVTVSLMEQAPPAITETVNRVVERTVERVVSGGQTASAAATELPQKTVLVRDTDVIPQALQVISPSIVRVFSNASTSPEFLGLGIVLDTKGTIVTDAESIGSATEVSIELSGTLVMQASVHSKDDALGTAYLAPIATASSSPAWQPAKIATAEPALGRTVVLVSGRSANRVGQGIITATSPLSDGIKDSSQVIETDLAKNGILSGSPIIDIDGAVVGLSTAASRAILESGFIAGFSLSPQMKEKSPTIQ